MTSDKIVSNSKQGLVVENLDKSKKSMAIHNGFVLSKFDKKKLALPVELAEKLNAHACNILMVARFDPSKDHATFIHSAELVIKDYPDVGFFCIGDGPGRNQAEKNAGSLLNKSIHFLGRREDIQQIIHAFDIGVMLNNTIGHAEGISNAIMEYMAAGLPVIATNAGGTVELVQDGRSGFLVPPFDPETVAKKIKILVEDEKLKTSMSQKGREIIKNDFNIRKMVESYKMLYNQIVVGH